MTNAFARWDAQMRLELAAASVDRATADTVLAEVAQHCAESGESPEEAFGTPREYAVAVVRERVPVEERARRNRDGLTRADDVFAALTTTGVTALLAGAYLWISTGIMPPLTAAGLVGTTFTAVALPSASLALTVSRHRLRTAAAWAVVALVSVVSAAVAFTTLPTTDFGRFPSPALCALGIALLWSATRTGPTTER
ncbi:MULTISPECIES: hypothetical protein [unclassified Streptomyces]|uniref:hypothetical protein n=1 Tax=unclassified Streptomyces TaxID=2593676 RepID=UPI003808367E